MSKARYRVTIERMPPDCRAAQEGYPFRVNFEKLYGDGYGGGGPYRTKEEILASFGRFRESWEGYDSILGRKGDKVTINNLVFHSEAPELQIKKGDFFGQASLF